MTSQIRSRIEYLMLTDKFECKRSTRIFF